MTSSVLASRTPIADVFGLLWDVVAFFWRHFFDILELLFVVVVLGVVVGIAAAATGTALSLTDSWRRWRSREPRGSAPSTQRPPAAAGTRAPATHRPQAPPRTRATPAPMWTPPTPDRTTRRTPPSAQRPVLKCQAEHNKTVFATEAKADAKVAQSKRRFALEGGQPPLDHSYACPHGPHWHVSSKPGY